MATPIIRMCATLFVFTVASCASDPAAPNNTPLGTVVVLNGQGETGVSVLPDEPGTPVHVPFSDFDGASFSIRNDTVISAASKAKGDLLYVADLKGRTVRKIQLPAASNPAGAQFALGPVFGLPSGAGTRLFVALRDSTFSMSVFLPADSGEPVLYRHPNAGFCPVDLVVTSGKVWYLDANQRCRTDYSIVGPSRLLPVANLGSSDTINLTADVVGAQRAIVVGNYAYVLSAGDFFSIPGALARVDLTARTSIVVPLPTNRYGVSLRVGANGFAYVTDTPAWPEVGFRVYAINLATMGPGGPRIGDQPHLTLIKPGGAAANCYVATADANGTIYCVENGDVLSTVLVFSATGEFLRSQSAGSLAFDIALR